MKWIPLLLLFLKNMTHNIDRKIFIKIKSIIFTNIENNSHDFFLFWSRVQGTASIKSDYDIWFIWETKLDPLIQANIEEAFEKIPALIDLIDFSKVSNDFKKEAMKNIIWLNK